MTDMDLHQRRLAVAAAAFTVSRKRIAAAERAVGIPSPPEPLTHPHSEDAGQPWSPWGNIAETET